MEDEILDVGVESPDDALDAGLGGVLDGPEAMGQEAPDAGQAAQDAPEAPEPPRIDEAAAQALARETEARLQQQYDEQIAGLGVPNPYTGKPFRSFKEFKEYGERFRQEQLEAKAKSTGKTVEELREEEENRSYLSQKRQEEKRQKEAMAALERQKAFIAADLDAFLKKFPSVDPGKLEANPKFRKFAGKRLYQEPLAELYSDFVELVSDAERSAVEKATGKAARSTGGGQGGGMDMLTPTQRAELKAWNDENPHMKMTAQEFLAL